jgi:TonB family protein
MLERINPNSNERMPNCRGFHHWLAPFAVSVILNISILQAMAWLLAYPENGSDIRVALNVRILTSDGAATLSRESVPRALQTEAVEHTFVHHDKQAEHLAGTDTQVKRSGQATRTANAATALPNNAVEKTDAPANVSQDPQRDTSRPMTLEQAKQTAGEQPLQEQANIVASAQTQRKDQTHGDKISISKAVASRSRVEQSSSVGAKPSEQGFERTPAGRKLPPPKPDSIEPALDTVKAHRDSEEYRTAGAGGLADKTGPAKRKSPVPFSQLTRLPVPYHLDLSSVYPKEERMHGREAKVMVSFVLTAQADARDIEIVESGGANFDKAAIEALRTKKIRYRPGYVGDEPVSVRVELPIEFTLVR